MTDQVSTVISVTENSTEILSFESVVQIVSEGTQGPEGKQGPAGVSDWNTLANKPPMYVQHDFLNSKLISFTHQMQKFPAVSVRDTSGNVWIPNQVLYAGLNDISVIFDTSFSGTIFLS